MNAPRNREELQSFLGFANYYRDFIPFHAAKVQPMQELLKKYQHFYWNEKHQEAFDLVKQALADATALAAPNEEGRFVLDTDASAVAIAGILHQEQEDNGRTIFRPIVYGSKSLTRTQLNYGAPKLEMYAVFYFIEKFHSYLVGREFTLRVDNQALIAENVLDGSGHDWTLDCASRPIPLQNDPQTTHTTQKCRWPQQKNQRLRASGEDRGKTTGSE